ncbi:hypothetical protein OLMES_4988 [Oleiphilus messinensis]|uniref:Uncharacterized protein n=1 Tax=Oleiphilus messinensis TaxID=141451 RepID=A0A1Y0IHF6_9GAMM|nr:hypothetical protein OLMES_4988 [Oleiphilus messinensis]
MKILNTYSNTNKTDTTQVNNVCAKTYFLYQSCTFIPYF